jgi:4-amino-4-deoxy-L-arabinose transferase-like glycosyltransferase
VAAPRHVRYPGLRRGRTPFHRSSPRSIMTALSRALVAVSDSVRVWPRWLTVSIVIGGFVLIFGLPTIIIPLATDEVLFAIGARTVIDGHQLYRDFWDIKPPLIYLLYALPLSIAGVHMEAVRVFDLLNTALAMAATYLLARRFFGERAGMIAAIFYGFTYLGWSPNDALGETESFMAAPLAFAFWLYLPDDARRDAPLRAVAAGLLLGVAFALKTSAVLFLFGLPLAELALRQRSEWRREGIAGRLALAALGFLAVQAALSAYLAIAGVLHDFIDIQRHYTLHYNAYRFAPGGHSHERFLLDATGIWIKDAAFLTVPAFAGLLVAFVRSRHARGAALLGMLALIGVVSIWWQGKMFQYHWLVVIPILAALAGFALDEAIAVFARLPRQQSLAALALLAIGLLALAEQPLTNTYDEYRTLIRYADGSFTRHQVEANYYPLYANNHQVVDYLRAHSDAGDRVYVWGFWPQVDFWFGHSFDRFVFNSGLRATWSPQSWRDELIRDLRAHPPRYIAIGQGDVQPWLVGTSQTSQQALDNFPPLAAIVAADYRPVLDAGVMVLYERQPAAVRADDVNGYGTD